MRGGIRRWRVESRAKERRWEGEKDERRNKKMKSRV